MRIKSLYIKAMLLLIIFSMNTAVGTACSLSKAFHSSHHHTTPDSGQHDHGDKKNHSHEHNGSHHSSDKSESDKCCSKYSAEFNKLDKSITPGLEVQVMFATTFVLTSNNYNVFLLSRTEDKSLNNHVRWRYPATIKDLRIVMQSFQI